LRGDTQNAAAILDENDLLKKTEKEKSVTRHLYLALRGIRENPGENGRKREVPGDFRDYHEKGSF